MLARLCHRPRPGGLAACCLLTLGVAALLVCSAASAATGSGGRAAEAASGSAARLGSPGSPAQLALQQAEVSASDGVAYSYFGYSVAISGDTALVGAPAALGMNIGPGTAYVFVRSGSSWVQQAELTPSDGVLDDQFGYSVAVSGDVALDGDDALVGAPMHQVSGVDYQGAAYLFTRSGSSWSQQAELTADDGASGDRFGYSVSLSGQSALVGALYHQVGDNDAQGAAYVFSGSGSSWSQQAELTADDGAAYDELGVATALSGDTALVGAYGSDSQQGAAYVFTRSGSSWSQQAELSAGDGVAGDRFGNAVALSGGTALVSAVRHAVGSNSQQGAAYVFTRSGAGWGQQDELTASDGAASNRFGLVALDGATALVGVPLHKVAGVTAQGATYVELLTPAADAAPVVSGSTAPGDTLSCTTGTWAVNPAPTCTYQWLRDGSAIDDATGANYVVQGPDCGHTLSCLVTATNGAGSTNATSNDVSVPAASAPANTERPVLSGDAAVGGTLSCSSGSWTGVPTPTLSCQWLRDGAAIADATDDTHTVTTADQGHLLSCKVTATNVGGALSETSDLVAVEAVLGAPTSVQAPVVSGSAVLGQVLSCSSGAWSGAVTSLDYQWLRNGVAIGGATGSTRRVALGDCGRRLTCVVTAANSAGHTSAASNGLSATVAPSLRLRVSRRAVTAGATVVISGAVRNPLAAARTLSICRRLHGRLIVLRRLTLTGSHTFRWTWRSHRGGLWRLVACYTAAGHRFQSKVVNVTVHKK